jgi:hypothetical protein
MLVKRRKCEPSNSTPDRCSVKMKDLAVVSYYLLGHHRSCNICVVKIDEGR